MDSIVIVRFQYDNASAALEEKICEYALANRMPIMQSDGGVSRVVGDGGKGRFDNPLIISIGGDGTFLRAAQLALTVYQTNHAIFPQCWASWILNERQKVQWI